MAKNKKFAKAMAKAAPRKGQVVTDPKGNVGVVTRVKGGMVMVRHNNGKSDVHPVGSVKVHKKVAKGAAPTPPSTSA